MVSTVSKHTQQPPCPAVHVAQSHPLAISFYFFLAAYSLSSTGTVKLDEIKWELTPKFTLPGDQQKPDSLLVGLISAVFCISECLRYSLKVEGLKHNGKGCSRSISGLTEKEPQCLDVVNGITGVEAWKKGSFGPAL